MRRLPALVLAVPSLAGASVPLPPALEAPEFDHVGINVPDADAAAQFFHDLIGTEIVLDMRPGDPGADWKARFRWHSSAKLLRILMIRTPGGSRIELFQYEAPEAAREHPHQDDPGATHIALKANDISKSIAVLKQRGLRVLNDPVTLSDGTRWFYFLTPWNSQLELVFPAATPR
jgi:catechol 2,3-dioxygenase-like lactoylglutathione lyase family enzyme